MQATVDCDGCETRDVCQRVEGAEGHQWYCTACLRSLMMKASMLKSYVDKRQAETDEPMDMISPGYLSGMYCVQEHDAKRAGWHEDFRFEHDGVAVSFAIPKGLPDKPARPRLAIRTEDHPLKYLEWEGTIPDGSYGAGTMRLVATGEHELIEFGAKKIKVKLSGDREGTFVFWLTDDRRWMVVKKR